MLSSSLSWARVSWLAFACLSQCGHAVDAASPPQRAQAAPAVGANELLDWAEFRYAPLFPKGPTSVALTHEGVKYTVRAYATGNYLGVAEDGSVVGLGPFTNGALTGFGRLADFSAQVRMDSCQVYPGSCSPSAPWRTWAAPLPLESSNDFNVADGGTAHQLNALNDQALGMVIWQQPDGQPSGDVSKVYSRILGENSNLQQAVQVPNLSGLSRAKLVDGKLFLNNQLEAVWVRSGLDVRRYSPSTGWSAPVSPPNKPSAAGQLSAAALDRSGRLHLLTAGSDVYHVTLAPSGQWSAWTRVDTSGSLNVDAADLALSANGSAMAIWVERNPGDANDSMKAARLDPIAGWQAPVSIDASFDDVDQGSPPRVAMDAQGHALAIWKQGNAVQVASFSPTAGWRAPQAFDAGALSTQPLRIRLAMNEAGQAVMGWQSGVFALKTLSYSRETGLATPLLAAPYALDRELGIEPSGEATLVMVGVERWPNPTSATLNLYALTLMPGQGRWSEPVLIETGPGDVKGGLAVSFAAGYVALASWAQNDVATTSARNSLWLSRYMAVGYHTQPR